MIKIKFKKNHSQIYYLEYWLGSHLPGMSTFITGKLCNGLLSYILLILLLSTRKCFRLFVRVTPLFIDNIKTIQNNYKCIACSDIQMIIFNINSLKYVLYNIFRLFFNFCAIVIPQAETRVNIRFWNGSRANRKQKLQRQLTCTKHETQRDDRRSEKPRHTFCDIMRLFFNKRMFFI